MKKTSFFLLSAIVVILVSFERAKAQKDDMAFNSASRVYGFLSPFEKMGFEDVKANNINIKAVRDFVKTFKSIDNNKWFSTDDGGFISTFTLDGIKTRVGYNNKGSRLYILKIYKENKMPQNIRHIVKREYYDATITLVKEVETNNGLIVFVHIQDKETWKIVRIVDGEMDLIENLNKR